jgi:hypothetical protein
MATAEQEGCPTMTAPGTEADVRVHAIYDDRLRRVLFALGGKVTPPGNGSVKGHVIEVKTGSGGARIRFKLKDKTDFDLQFRSRDPIWVTQGADCPAGSGLGSFSVSRCDGTDLVLDNPAGPGTYAYTLWFVDEDGNEYEFDPIIKNRA